jgi:hypothetical protein
MLPQSRRHSCGRPSDHWVARGHNDWSKVGAALGKSGTEMPGGVYRVAMPRTDLHVTLDGVERGTRPRSWATWC